MNDKISFFEQVYEIVRRIPKGRATTYGAIANFLDTGSARMVGWAMNHSHGDGSIPAHRVVNRKGELSGRNHFATPQMMQEMLEQEGIMIENNCIQDFDKVFWNPSNIK